MPFLSGKLLKVGDILIAKDVCKMSPSGRVALSIGEKYPIHEVLGDEIMLYTGVNEPLSPHYFSNEYIHKYFYLLDDKTMDIHDNLNCI